MTTRTRQANLAFLTVTNGKPMLNLQFAEPGIARGKADERIEITPQQLANICADGVKALWGGVEQ